MENSVMKENIHLMSIVGYFSSTLCGAIMGLLFYILFGEMGLSNLVSAMAAWAIAAAVAAVLLCIVWLAAREPKKVNPNVPKE